MAKHPDLNLMAGSRDWAGLDEGPLGIIADRVLSYDVADFLRFRAVCCPWRQSSADPHAHVQPIDCVQVQVQHGAWMAWLPSIACVGTTGT